MNAARLAEAPATVDLTIVIVTWNGRDLVLDCLDSIREAGLELTHEVVVVDNGSDDATVECVARDYPDVRVLALGANAGFGAANNRALAEMNGRFAVLLNNDALLLPGALERAVAYLDAHPEAGVAAPQLLNPDRSKQNCIHNAPTLLSEIVGQSLLRRIWPRRYPGKRQHYDAPLEVEGVLGACMVVRREAIARVGLLDEAYFFFLEETDWCQRIREAGWRVIHLPDVAVIHLHGETSKRRQPLRTRIEYYRSRYTFFEKHRGPASRLGLRAFLALKLALGALLGGRRAAEYRKIWVWHREGRPAAAGLQKT